MPGSELLPKRLIRQSALGKKYGVQLLKLSEKSMVHIKPLKKALKEGWYGIAWTDGELNSIHGPYKRPKTAYLRAIDSNNSLIFTRTATGREVAEAITNERRP